LETRDAAGHPFADQRPQSPLLPLTHHDHGRALGQHEGQHEVAHLAVAQRVDAAVVGVALAAAVPGKVVIGAVPWRRMRKRRKERGFNVRFMRRKASFFLL
jgi:hypothetical protein